MPIFGRQVLRLLAHARPGIIDNDVETSKSVDRVLYRCMTGFFLQNIELYKLSLSAERMQLR